MWWDLEVLRKSCKIPEEIPPVPMSRQARHFYEFVSFCLDARERLLTQGGKYIPLAPKTFEALLVFVRDPGHLIQKDDLLKQLWPDTFVEEANLTKHISLLRKALGETGNGQEYIETIPKHGYRFVPSVAERDGIPEEAEKEVIAFAASRMFEPAADQDVTVQSPGSDTKVMPLDTRIPAAAPRSHGHTLALIGAAAFVLAVSVLGIHRWISSKPPVSLENMEITKLTDSGTVVNVAISPDGRHVAYEQRDGGKWGLWLHQMATNSVVQILPPDTNVFHGLTFSTDGSHLYFVRSDKDNPGFSYLYSMPVLGGLPRRLLANIDSPVSFSPDGRQFVFTRGIPTHNDVEVRTANSDGSNDHLLATMHNRNAYWQRGATWSPDGQTIALSVVRWDKQIGAVLNTVSVADGSVRELYSSSDPIGRPIWSPRGDSMLVPLVGRGGRGQLWLISYPQGKARRITNDLADYDFPIDGASDGKTVAAIGATQVSNVWVAPQPNPSNGRQITFGPLSMLGIADTKEGKLLLSSADGRLWVTNPDGSQRPQFVWQGGSVMPCGNFVLFESFESGTMTLMRINPDFSNPTVLASGDLFAPVCSPDGKFVFYASFAPPQAISRISVEGGTPVRIAQILGDGIVGRPGISPDGKFLEYAFQEFKPPAWKLAVIALDSGKVVKTIAVPGGIQHPRWSLDGEGLQYALFRDGASNIWEQPLTGGEPKQLTNFTSGIIFDFNWSLDGKKLLMTRGEITSDVVLISNFR
jgi:DNA-binding winged helix-turn-helix (wHTH) protein/Tol biopolymer transport system component